MVLKLQCINLPPNTNSDYVASLDKLLLVELTPELFAQISMVLIDHLVRRRLSKEADHEIDNTARHNAPQDKVNIINISTEAGQLQECDDGSGGDDTCIGCHFGAAGPQDRTQDGPEQAGEAIKQGHDHDHEIDLAVSAENGDQGQHHSKQLANAGQLLIIELAGHESLDAVLGQILAAHQKQRVDGRHRGGHGSSQNEHTQQRIAGIEEGQQGLLGLSPFQAGNIQTETERGEHGDNVSQRKSPGCVKTCFLPGLQAFTGVSALEGVRANGSKGSIKRRKRKPNTPGIESIGARDRKQGRIRLNQGIKHVANTAGLEQEIEAQCPRDDHEERTLEEIGPGNALEAAQEHVETTDAAQNDGTDLCGNNAIRDHVKGCADCAVLHGEVRDGEND